MNAGNRNVREQSLGCAKGVFAGLRSLVIRARVQKHKLVRKIHAASTVARCAFFQEYLPDEPPGPARAAAEAGVAQGRKTRGLHPPAIFLW